MKKTIISMIAAGVLASATQAQVIYLGGTSDLSNPASLKVTGTDTNNVVNSNNNLGIMIQLDFGWDISTGTFELTVSNVSGFASSILGFGINHADSLSYLGMTQTAQSAGVGTFTATANVSGSDISPFGGTIDIFADAPSQGGPNVGIENGESATFEFAFNGAAAGNFSSVQSFFDGLVGSDFNDDNGDVGNFDMIFRVQGVAFGAGSDKIGVNFPGDDDGGGSGFVPEPSTYGMFGALALLGVMVVRQVRRR